MGGRGSWSSMGGGANGGGGVLPPRGGRSKPSDGLDPLLPGGSVGRSIKNFQDFIGDSDVEYSVVFNENGYPVGTTYRGARHSTSVDLAAAIINPNSVMVHNHPSKTWGGTFSRADLQAHANAGNRGMVASGREGTYVMLAGRNSDYAGFGRAYDRARSGLEAQAAERTRKALAGKTFKTDYDRQKAERQIYVGVFHRWYKDNAGKYGLTYVYAKGQGQRSTSRLKINSTYKDFLNSNLDYDAR